MANDIKQLGQLALGLLVLMIVLAITFIVGAQFQKSICEDIDGSTSTAGVCAAPSTAYNVTGVI